MRILIFRNGRVYRERERENCAPQHEHLYMHSSGVRASTELEMCVHLCLYGGRTCVMPHLYKSYRCMYMHIHPSIAIWMCTQLRAQACRYERMCASNCSLLNSPAGSCWKSLLGSFLNGGPAKAFQQPPISNTCLCAETCLTPCGHRFVCANEHI